MENFLNYCNSTYDHIYKVTNILKFVSHNLPYMYITTLNTIFPPTFPHLWHHHIAARATRLVDALLGPRYQQALVVVVEEVKHAPRQRQYHTRHAQTLAGIAAELLYQATKPEANKIRRCINGTNELKNR